MWFYKALKMTLSQKACDWGSLPGKELKAGPPETASPSSRIPGERTGAASLARMKPNTGVHDHLLNERIQKGKLDRSL